MPGAALALTLALAGCGPPREQQAPPPNIVLITIDTLRADHLSCDGYHRTTTPFIDTLADRGTVFRNAYATSSWTAPSMASIFTSLYPRSHGVLHGFVRRQKVVDQEKLSPTLATIAGELKKHGYRTFGVSTNAHMSPETGFDRGFDRYESIWFGEAPEANAAAEKLRGEIERASPFFLWVHYFDPHAAYYAREPWISDYNPDKSSYEEWAGRRLKWIKAHRKRLIEQPGGIQALRDLYDSEINYTDDYLKKLFESLPLPDNSIVIVTADHGESFFDHGRLLGHGVSLFQEVVRVPLLVVLPGGKGLARTVDSPASIIDIFPTILDAAGIAAPPSLQGRSLLPLMRGGAASPERAVFLELDRGRHQKAVVLGGWKYVCRGRALTKCALYDLRADPRETRNLAAQRPEIARRMEAVMREWLAESPAFNAPVVEKLLEKERLDELKALGYIQ